VKAVVTDLVPGSSRAIAFGWLAFVRGVGLLVSGGLLGVAYDAGTGWVVGVVVGANVLAVLGLARVLGRGLSAG
jgi:hypothetical protein